MYVSYGVLANVPGPNGAVNPDTLKGLDPTSLTGNTPIGVVNSTYYTSVGGFGLGIGGISNQIAVDLKEAVKESLGLKVCNEKDGLLGCVASFTPLNFFFDINSSSVISTVFDIISSVAGSTVGLKIATFTSDTVRVGDSIPFIGGFINTLVDATSAPVAGLMVGLATYTLTETILREVLPWLIIFLVVYIAIFMALLKLWIELLKSFVFVLFDIIFAPFWIIAGLIPGNTSINVSSWLKDLVANLAAFPAAAGMLMLGKILMDAFSPSNSGIKFIPPLVGNFTSSNGTTNFLGAVIGLAVILSTPQVVSMVKKALKAPDVKLGAFGAALGAGAGAPKRMVSGGISTIVDPFRGNKEGGSLWQSVLRNFK